MIIKFLIGIIVYSLVAVTSYSETIKRHPLYFALGIGLGVIANFIWLSIARDEADSSKLVLTGLYWDLMLLSVYMVIPLMFFGARFTLTQGLGVAAILVGIVLTKL